MCKRKKLIIETKQESNLIKEKCLQVRASRDDFYTKKILNFFLFNIKIYYYTQNVGRKPIS